MNYLVASLSIAILASGAAFAAPALADTYTYKQVDQGPAVVLDSWMQPTVMRTRAIRDSDGSTTTVEEPLVMERHERVVVPETETTTTTNVIPSTEIRTEQRQLVSYGTSSPAKKRPHAKKKVAIKKPQTVAYPARQPRQGYVAQKVVEQHITHPTVVEETATSVHKETVIERRHPALDLY